MGDLHVCLFVSFASFLCVPLFCHARLVPWLRLSYFVCFFRCFTLSYVSVAVQGNVIHLGERDCSVQRRYQKVIEVCCSLFFVFFLSFFLCLFVVVVAFFLFCPVSMSTSTQETPSPFIKPDLRARMGKSAVTIAKLADYVGMCTSLSVCLCVCVEALVERCIPAGAGTVEFLVDQDSNYYFLEVNTRLQVCLVPPRGCTPKAPPYAYMHTGGAPSH